LILLVIGIVSAVFFVRRPAVSAREGVSLLKTQMIMRLIQIPGYVICFALAVLFLMTIFTVGFSLFLLILDSASILITGLFSIPVYAALYKNGQISKRRAIGYSVLSFVFCADVVVSIFCYRQVKDLKNDTTTFSQKLSDTDPEDF
jgi:ABC-type polysaccharide transport system permease subunit